MTLHETLARRVKLNIYFADPHSPWQRGTKENINGLLRQYMSKGTDLTLFSQYRLKPSQKKSMTASGVVWNTMTP
jgi:IS30 family transposase